MTRRLLLLTTVAVVLLGLSLPSLAQEALAVDIRRAELDDDGTTTVTVSVTGDAVSGEAPGSAFTVLEDGTPVEGLEVTPLFRTEEQEPVVAVLAIDASGSAAGEPMDNARQAAIDFVKTVVPRGVRVGVVTFSDEATLTVTPTDDVDELTAAIEDVEAGGATALYDAVVVAARTAQNFEGQRSIVVFSDGGDTISDAPLNGAITATQTVDASVTTVALDTEDSDPTSLQSLADESGGRVLTVDDAGSLQEAFQTVAQTLTNQYRITYDGEDTGADEILLTVAVSLGATEASDQATVVSPRSGPSAGAPRVVNPRGPSVYGSDLILYVALGVVFVGILLFLVILLVPTGDRRVARTLRRGLGLYDRKGHRAAPTDTTRRITSSDMTRRAVDLVARVPRPAGYDEGLQLKLDRADWPIRSTEFTAARVGLFVFGSSAFYGLLGNVVFGLLIGVALAVLPRVVVDARVTARQNKFVEQMPDTLQLLAGALKAGYGLLQAIDTVVKESPDPTAAEYSRVLTEARLGLPLEDSLESMAERVGSEDFRWVVVAVNIQRRVGGNLAELLETVADTLRERAMVRRQIKTLSAEGRLSAIILVALPFVVALYLFLVNPAYIGLLFQRSVGLVMVVGSALLIAVGIMWMRKLINIDV